MKRYINSKGYNYIGEFDFGNEFSSHIGERGDGSEYLIVYEVSDFYVISKEILETLSQIFKGTNTEIHTNAGVDIHSSSKGKYRDLIVRRLEK